MQKDNLVATLLELEALIKPGKVENVLLEFGKELLRRFNLNCFVAEIPMLGLRVEIPEGCDGGNFQYEGTVARFRIRGDIKGLEKPMRPSGKTRLRSSVQHILRVGTRIFEESPDHTYRRAR